jgi:hypothetical protein
MPVHTLSPHHLRRLTPPKPLMCRLFGAISWIGNGKRACVRGLHRISDRRWLSTRRLTWIARLRKPFAVNRGLEGAVIAPFRYRRFPRAESTGAYAFAYGGCLIQDLGYYPFSSPFFSEITHYVRSGDFVESLFRKAHTADELAFAIGALSHYIGDCVGYSQATNRSLAIEFSGLRAKFGSSVNYPQAKNGHGRVEFAYDIPAYLRYIGF